MSIGDVAFSEAAQAYAGGRAVAGRRGDRLSVRPSLRDGRRGAVVRAGRQPGGGQRQRDDARAHVRLPAAAQRLAARLSVDAQFRLVDGRGAAAADGVGRAGAGRRRVLRGAGRRRRPRRDATQRGDGDGSAQVLDGAERALSGAERSRDADRRRRRRGDAGRLPAGSETVGRRPAQRRAASRRRRRRERSPSRFDELHGQRSLECVVVAAIAIAVERLPPRRRPRRRDDRSPLPAGDQPLLLRRFRHRRARPLRAERRRLSARRSRRRRAPAPLAGHPARRRRRRRRAARRVRGADAATQPRLAERGAAVPRRHRRQPR